MRYEVRVKMAGGELDDQSEWMTSAVNLAFRELDPVRFVDMQFAAISTAATIPAAE
jgi:hypothetical protein